MLRLIFKIIIFTYLSLFCNLIFSQDDIYSKFTKRADISYTSNEYFKALNMYKDLYKESQNKEEKNYISFRIAECYRNMNQTQKAESQYLKVITKNYQNPLIYYYYADMLQRNEKYAEAAVQYEEYLKRVPNDEKAKVSKVSCSLSARWIESPTRYVIENRKELNSKESDFAPAYASSDYLNIYFTSTRPGFHGEKINPVTGQIYSDIFETSLDKKGDWSKPVPLNDTINSPNDDGTPFLAENYNSMYFTRCKVVRGIKLGCQIYKATRDAGEDWQKYEIVQIANDSISVGYPSLSKDGLTLYFVAKMQGGFGGNDIWVMTRKSRTKAFGNLENLGIEINTLGDEMFPFIRENGILYFCSNGHPGMGGLDIFKATKNEENEWEVENMRYPINSSQDDFNIIFKGNNEEGLFSSSRKGGKGKDDIYSFILPSMEFVLQGVIKDENSDKPIKGARIRIVGSDGTDLDITTLDDGSFRYKLNPHTNYIYLAKKEGYLNGKGRITTAELADSKTFSDEIRLSSIKNPVEVENVLYDFGKWELRPEAKKELNGLIDILKANPNITIELGSNTDMVGDSTSNFLLSQKRAQSVVDYLVEKGITKDRLSAKGYGKSLPKVINGRNAKAELFKEGDVLSEEFINKLATPELKEKANQMNRRTEFKVLTTNYIPDVDEE
jgi:peptidoglycan-associated lipoprotein